MSDLSETELKFVLTAEAAASLAERMFAAGAGRQLVSIYFDTPELDLQRRSVALRLRRSGDDWVQTLKVGGAGAIRRFEDEVCVAGGELDLQRWSGEAMAHLPKGAHQRLQPVFETRVTRRTVMLVQDDAHIEAALDEGEIHANHASTPIRELELELKAGPLAGLLTAAREIADLPGVRLSLVSKAERGYRLATGRAAQAVKFHPPPLDLNAPVTAAFQSIAMAALHQVTANADLLHERASPEAVHQARVGLRRLRTYVGAFKAWVGDVRLPVIQATLKRLTAVFEDARAMDVFEMESFVPFARHEAGAAAFGRALLAAREEVYRKTQDEIRGQAFAGAVFEVAEWVLDGPWLRTLAIAPSSLDTLAAAADRLLSHRWRKLRRRGRRLDWSDARGRHKLRIQAKKMRYLTDAFHARGRRSAKALEALQTDLGALNDIATAPDAARLALALAPPEAAFVAGAVVGVRRAGVARQVRAARRAFRRMARRPRPRVG